MADHISYFDDLEEHVQKLLDALEETMPEVNKSIMDAVNDLFYELDTSAGSIEASVSNLKVLDGFKTKLNSIIENGKYSDSVNEFLNGYVKSSDYINGYFSAISGAFTESDALYNAILQSNIKTTADSLLGSGVNANFTDPVMKILRDQVTTGANKQAFIQALKANIEGENPLLSRFINQVASDSITQFNSNYINAISTDLGLEYYYYKGTKISDTRPFCSLMAGKYFTEAQLKARVQQQMSLNGGKGWQGMVKGENWTNFPIYRGGYNCRHYLIPVSKEIYDKAVNKWVA